ncbi:DUF2849 domain-containing protein [Emcibacter sp.]|uniref:DUF2849 domain-containing protein n=1 Tax=Emcibacter sp. TaxID=1979954 RepID=UPI002AA67154|nr:DUF2849 domain-containing protein [Emcibacter sp.]
MSDKQIITANHLQNGLNVYFVESADSVSWDTDIAAASRFDKEALEAALARAAEGERNNIVVGIYAIEADDDSAREKIRAQGPSIKYGHEAN